MTPLKAWRDGMRRVVSAPSVLVGVWTITTLAALPLVYAIRADIVSSLGRSLTADAAARGMNYEWMQEFAGHATGLASTFRPTIVGFAAVLDNLSAFIDNVQRPSAVAAASGIYVLIWVFLAGAVINRYAGSRAARPKGFFAAGATYFFRFFRLAIVAAIVYGLLFGALHPWLFTRVYPSLTRGVDVERTAFMIRAGLYLVFVLILAAVNLVFDYAKVRAVVEDRRSVIVALIASWRFIRRNPAGAVGVYLLNALLFAALLAAYAFVAPPGGGVGVMAWAAFGVGQAYITGRLCVRLLFFASETVLVEATLKGSPYEERT
jgi:hypothetical protein